MAGISDTGPSGPAEPAVPSSETRPRMTPVMSERRVSLLGALLVATGPVAMALYTPAMPGIAEEMATTDSMVQMTLAVFFGGFALAQLVAGPLSDALGRRPVVLGFMVLFLVG